MGEQDFLNKRAEDVKTFFGLAVKDVRTFILVLSVVLNLFLIREIVRINNDRISDKDEIYNIVIKELRNQLPRQVKQEVKEQVKPIAESVDTAKTNIDKFIERVSK